MKPNVKYTHLCPYRSNVHCSTFRNSLKECKTCHLNKDDSSVLKSIENMSNIDENLLHSPFTI